MKCCCLLKLSAQRIFTRVTDPRTRLNLRLCGLAVALRPPLLASSSHRWTSSAATGKSSVNPEIDGKGGKGRET
ncbi:unnamed protein product [Victoria cruziana]